MIKNRYLIAQITCVALLIAFVVFLFVSRNGGTEKRVKEISAPVLKVIDISQMSKKSALSAAQTFGFDTEKEEGILYYNNDNIMNCSELLIIKLKNPEDMPAFKALVEQRVENQKNLFKNYAPEQYSLLDNSIIAADGNTLFYCTALNADEVYAAFKKAL